MMPLKSHLFPFVPTAGAQKCPIGPVLSVDTTKDDR
jgi:hypothetical protein